MTDKTPDSYQDAVQKLMDYLDNAVLFANQQLPDVAKQILVYGADVHHFWLMFWCVAAGLTVIMWVVFLLAGQDGEIASIASFALFLWFSIVAANQYIQLMKIRDAPKVYIMDELAEMVHKQ